MVRQTECKDIEDDEDCIDEEEVERLERKKRKQRYPCPPEEDCDEISEMDF